MTVPDHSKEAEEVTCGSDASHAIAAQRIALSAVALAGSEAMSTSILLSLTALVTERAAVADEGRRGRHGFDDERAFAHGVQDGPPSEP
jgi:hypothetical protein